MIAGGPLPASSGPRVYDAVREKLHDGDLLLFQARGIVASVIRWATRSKYSHAGLAVWFDDRLLVLESRELRGCRLIALSDALRAARSITVYRPHDAGPFVGFQAVRAGMERLGQPYGWKQILRDALGRLPLLALLLRRKQYSEDDAEEPERGMKCSTFVAWAWRRAGYDLVPNLADASTDPGDLARSAALMRGPELVA